MRPTARTTLTALVATLALAGWACKEKPAVIDGIGNWHLGVTKLSEASGRCTPQKDGTMWCSFQPMMNIAEQKASVDLYFGGATDDSLLVEILLNIQRCKPDTVQMAFEHQLGPAQESVGTLVVWSTKAAVILARLPMEGDECEVSFVAPSDAKRIAQIRKN